MKTRPKAPRCSRCDGPAHNVNRHGELTGEHRDIEQCLSETTARLEKLEDFVATLVVGAVCGVCGVQFDQGDPVVALSGRWVHQLCFSGHGKEVRT